MNFRKTISRILCASALAIFAAGTPLVAQARDNSLGDGVRRVNAEIDGMQIEVYTYHPRDCASPTILMVFHGNSRAARSYLNSSREIAQQSCFTVYAPRFDKDRFPGWSYHRGGLIHDGELLPEEDWTVEMVGDLLDWARKQEGTPEAQAILFGHSAGGQFLSRVAAYAMPENVQRIVIANPSTYVLPTTDEPVPYGYGGLPADDAQTWMQAYLAAPVTIYLGDEDTGSKLLTMNRQAQEQGNNRLNRGQNTFEAAKEIATKNGWPFNWQLVHADGIGHSGRGMLQANEMVRALGY